MVDKSYMRSRIISFFKDKKLNKNSYFKAWYDKYDGGEEIYNYINEFYSNTPVLNNLPLGQKLYHIVNDINYLPDLRFINFKRGYVKGYVSFSGKSITTFLDRLKKEHFESSVHISRDKVKLQLLDYIRRSAYTSLLQDNDLIYNIFKHTEDVEDIQYKFASICNDSIHCLCGNYCSFKNKHTFSLNTTCGKKSCISEALSNFCKSRDLSYLQSNDIKAQRVKSRKWYRHSELTKDKISASNKKTWTKDKRYNQTKVNREDGVYERVSEVMKNKILAGEYTPNTKNRYTNKRLYSKISGIDNYRSNWEVIFHETNPYLDYELIRIPYTHDGKEKVYIVDFCDRVNKILYEVKPYEFINQPLNQSKFKAARLWCEKNGYTFKLILKDDICKKI